MTLTIFMLWFTVSPAPECVEAWCWSFVIRLHRGLRNSVIVVVCCTALKLSLGRQTIYARKNMLIYNRRKYDYILPQTYGDILPTPPKQVSVIIRFVNGRKDQESVLYHLENVYAFLHMFQTLRNRLQQNILLTCILDLSAIFPFFISTMFFMRESTYISYHPPMSIYLNMPQKASKTQFCFLVFLIFA